MKTVLLRGWSSLNLRKVSILMDQQLIMNSLTLIFDAEHLLCLIYYES